MKLKHPESDQTVETTTEHAEMYLSQGWAEVKASAKSKSDDDK